MSVLNAQPNGATGRVAIDATVTNVVSLTIEDSPSNGGDLVNSQGIHFGEVNSLGESHVPGVIGSQKGNVGHFEAKFIFRIERSGQGRLHLTSRRAEAGNFHAQDGIEISDQFGVLKALSALNPSPVTLLNGVSPGEYEKTIAINIHPNDKGTLRSVLQFTLCTL